MMEFEEMQKIWNEQKGETMYAINETALHKSVTRKKNAASRRINRVEIILTLVNSTVAIILISIALVRSENWEFITSGLMAASVAYIQYFRWKRKKAENTFDRSMLGELDHAIWNTNSIIRFNYFMYVGYLIPFALIKLSEMIVNGAGLVKWLVVVIALAL